MKRFIAILCITMLCTSTVYGNQIGNTQYNVTTLNANNGISPYANEEFKIGKTTDSDVIAKLDAEGTLAITGTGDTIVFTLTSLPPWKSVLSEIKKVTIDPAVTPINMDYWFKGCSKLVDAPKIPSSVKSMQSTFSGCSELVNAPDMNAANTVENMSDTFYGCKLLTGNITIPNSVKNMSNMFNGCIALTKTPTIPSSVVNMKQAFIGCTSLVTAESIPANVEDIASLFSGCTTLSTVLDLSNLDKIEDMTNVFKGCAALTSAPQLPSKTTTLKDTFNGCVVLINPPTIPADVITMTRTFLGCVALKAPPVIPTKVSNLIETFKNCKELTGIIKIPDLCKELGTTFTGTVKDITVSVSAANKGALNTIPATLTNIKRETDTGTWDIGKTPSSISAEWNNDTKTLNISGSGEMIDFKADKWWETSQYYTNAPWHALVHDEVEMNVVINEGITSIGNNAFFGAKITSLIIPSSCVKIGESAFEKTIIATTDLKPLEINNVNCVIGNNAFKNSHTLKYLKIIAKSIGESAFKKELTGRKGALFTTSDNLIKAVINVESIGKGSFSNVAEVASERPDIELGSSLKTIEDNAFSNKGLLKLTMPDNVDVGAGAFYNCDKLTMDFVVKSISGDNTFKNCKQITSVSVTGNTPLIGDSVFENCLALKSVTLPSTVTSIGANVFKGCVALENIDIPFNVSKLGANLFSGCTGLKTVKNNSKDPQTISPPVFIKGAHGTLKVTGYDSNTTFKKDVEDSEYTWVSIKVDDTEKPVVNKVEIVGSKITITATDNVSVTKYGYSDSNNGANVLNWESENIFESVQQGKEFFAFAKDADDNISDGFKFKLPDTEVPIITGITVDSTTKKATITATDNIAISEYGFSTSNNISSVNWGTSNIVTVPLYDTMYYAFVKDTTQNTSIGKEFIVTDTIPPVISSVDIVHLDRSITINATDNADTTKIRYGYCDTNDSTKVTNWQDFNKFNSLLVNKDYFAFAKDNKSNVSVGKAFKVNKIIKSLVSLNTGSFKKEYNEGEELVLTGLTATVKYNDDSNGIVPITNSMVTGYNKTKIGTQTLTITIIAGIVGTVDVTVDAIDSISVSGVKTVYEQNEVFSPTGILIVKYKSGTTKQVPVDMSMLEQNSFNTSTIGSSQIQLNYGGKSVTYNITVTGTEVDVIDSIRVEGAKTEYLKGDTFFVQGNVVATYKSGVEKKIALTKAMTTNFDTAVAGSYTITVTYTEAGADYITNYSILVKEPIPVTPVTITTTVDDTSYQKSKTVEIATTGKFKEITTPSGKVYGEPDSSGNYTSHHIIIENGGYTFSVLGKDEKSGASSKVDITKIDREPPTIVFGYTSDMKTVNIDVIDNGEADRLILPDKTVISSAGATTVVFDIVLNHGGTFVAYDTAGNMSSKDLFVQNVVIGASEEPTTVMLNNLPMTWTNKDANINVGAYNLVDGVQSVDIVKSGLNYVSEIIPINYNDYENNNGIILCGNTEDSQLPVFTDINVSENGTYVYTVKVLDEEYTEEIDINYIDKELPVVNVNVDGYLAKIDINDSLSGIRSIVLPDGSSIENDKSEVNEHLTEMLLKPGSYNIIVEDYAGNYAKHEFTIAAIEKTRILVSYNINGGTGSVTPVSEYIEDTKITVSGSENIVAPSGMKFKNWNTINNGTGNSYVQGSSIIAGNTNITLYAIYENDTSGGGSGGGGSSGGSGSGGGSSNTDKKPIEAPEINDLPKVDDTDTGAAYLAGTDRIGIHLKLKNGYLVDQSEITAGYIGGYPDGTFKPNNTMTRQEFASVLDRILLLGDTAETVKFDDMDDKWGKDAVIRLASKGIISGTGNNKFEPERSITREETIIMISKFVNLKSYPTECELKDISNSICKDEISRAYNAGIISGSDNKFNGKNSITRAEAVTMLNQIFVPLEQLIKENKFSDVNKTDWFYNQIMKASK